MAVLPQARRPRQLLLLSCALGATAAGAAALPTGNYRFLSSASTTALGLRHCNYQLFATPDTPTNADFVWAVVPALNGNAGAFSIQSTNFPARYVTVYGAVNGVTEPLRLGVLPDPPAENASFVAVAGLSNASAVSLVVDTGPLAGYYVTHLPGRLSGSCTYTAPSGDVALNATAAAACPSCATWRTVYTPPPSPPAVVVNVTNVSHAVNKWIMGAHTDPGYTQQPWCWYSQMVVGASFETGPSMAVPSWVRVNATGTSAAAATVGFDTATLFNGVRSMKFTYPASANALPSGFAGLANRGLGAEGLYLQAGKPYEGYVFAKGSPGTNVTVALQDFTTGATLASGVLTIPDAAATGAYTAFGFVQLNFTLAPSAGTACVHIPVGSDPAIDCHALTTPANPADHACVRCGGQFAVGLTAPGSSVNVGYVFLQPATWGRIGSLPARREMADVIAQMGVTIVRQGGTVSQTYAWKDWRGPPWARRSMQHTWGFEIDAGWGPFEQLDVAEYLGYEAVLTFAYDLNSAADWADLVEYVWGGPETTWGALRVADGRPQPYTRISMWELGNEQDNPNFVQQVAAMEARATALGMPGKLKFIYPTNGGVSAATASALVAAGIAPARVMMDVHPWNFQLGLPMITSAFAANPSFLQSGICLETNNNAHDFARALFIAQDINEWLAATPPFADRLVARTESFIGGRSGHFDAFDQSLAFFLPNQTWLQPPGWVHAMITATWGDLGLPVAYATPAGAGGLSVTAQRSSATGAVHLRIVNNQAWVVNASFTLTGGDVGGSVNVTTLRAPAGVTSNRYFDTDAIRPVTTIVQYAPGGVYVPIPASSYSVLSFAAVSTPSASPSASGAPTPTRSTTGSPTATQVESLSPSASPSASPLVRTPGAVALDLWAADYDASGLPHVWDNRASPGPPAPGNGDFFSNGPAASLPSKRVVGGVTAVVFNASIDGVPDRLEAASAWFPDAVYGASAWSFEAWAWQDAHFSENPLLQWGPRSAATCTSAFVGTGSHATWGAGGHYNCDVAYTEVAGGATEWVPASAGWSPTVGGWRYVAMTYTGTTQAPTNVVSVYVDGALSTLVAGRALSILRPANLTIGCYRDTVGVYSVGASLAVARMRLSAGALSAADVAANYAAEAPLYRPSPSGTPPGTPSPTATRVGSLSASPTPSGTPSPSGCPPAYASSHVHRALSLQLATETSTYFRHGCYYIFATPAYPVVASVASADATHIVRLGLDGTPGTVSLQSSNYPARYLTVMSDGYLYFDTLATINASAAGRSAASWHMEPHPDGGVLLRSRSPAFFLNPAAQLAAPSTSVHTCVVAGATVASNQNVGVWAPGSGTGGAPLRWAVVDPLAPPASYAAPAITDAVVVEAAGPAPRGRFFLGSCGGAGGASAVVARNATWTTPAAVFTLVPPVDCPAACAGPTFSLRPSTSSVVSVAADGSLVSVPRAGGASAAVTNATLYATRATVDGVAGFVLSTLPAAAAGLVLTAGAAGSAGGTAAAGCGDAAAATVVLAPVPPTGLAAAHLFRLHWQDGSGELSALPSGGGGGQAACALPASPSPAPSQTASPTGTPTPSLTASGTPSPSGTPPPTISPGASPSGTGSGTRSPSATPPGTASASGSPTPPPTPSSTPRIRVVGAGLVVDLRAADFGAANAGGGYPAVWDNRALGAPGNVSAANGDFVATGGSAAYNPTFGAVGPLGTPAVVFDPRADGVADRLESAYTAYAPSSIFGASEWSVEMWAWTPPGYDDPSGETPVLQWGARPGTACNSAYFGLGAHPDRGAGGHWGACEAGFGPTDTTEAVNATWVRPRAGVLNHVAWAYCLGALGSGVPSVESVYVNGALSRAYPGRQLSIARAVNLRLGQFAGGGDAAGVFALAALRVHDGCLTAGDVAANYAAEAPLYVATPSPTASGTGSASGTPAATGTGTSTQVTTLSGTGSPSATPSPSGTPSGTPAYAVPAGGRTYVDLRAADYDPATGVWRNRAAANQTPPLTQAGGHFGPTGVAGFSTPSKAAVNGLEAVLFDGAGSPGALPRLTATAAAFPATAFYGSSAWSVEVWAYQATYYPENALLQWGPRGGVDCSGAGVGMGGHPVYGAVWQWNCDSPWGNAAFGTSPNLAPGGGGQAPRAGAFHHIVVTYTGAAGAPAFFESVYLDGALSSTASGRALSIGRTVPVAVGSWTTADVASNAAILRMRMHSGVLTGEQVAATYAGELVSLGIPGTPSPSSSPSAAATGSSTPTGTGTSAVTATGMPSRTAAASTTGTASGSAGATATGTPTPSPSTAASLSPSVTAAATQAATSSATSSRSATPPVTGSTTGSPTPVPTGTPTGTAAATTSVTGSPTGTAATTASPSGTRSASPPATPTSSPSPSLTRTDSATPSGTASTSAAATQTPSLTRTATGSLSAAPTVTPSPSFSGSGSGSLSATASVSGTPSPSGTSKPAATNTPTCSRSAPPSSSKSALPSRSGSPTRTRSRTRSQTPTRTRSKTASRTRTRSASRKKKRLAAI